MAKSVAEVEVGDILSVYNRDFIVDQVFRLGHGGSQWANYRLKDGSEVKWFALRGAEQGLQVLGQEMPLFTKAAGKIIDQEAFQPAGQDEGLIRGEPGDKQLTLGGKPYELVATVQGRATGVSAMGYPRYINIRFYDYAGEKPDHYLFVQKDSDSVIIFAGEAVIASAVMVFPKPI